MKVICAGAPKTGTKSIAKAFRILGYDAVYDAEEAVQFAFKEWEDVWKRKQSDMKVLMDTAYSNVEAVVDMPHSTFFDKFLERWPDAKVILMLRDEDKWFKSYKDMCDRANESFGHVIWLKYLSPTLHRMMKWQEMLFITTVGSFYSHDFVWKSWYKRHNSYVRSVVPKSQLLEYDVSKGWEPLCKFLEKPIPDEKFPMENRAGSANRIEVTMMQETWIAKKVKKELTIIFSIIPLLLVITICYFFFS